MGPDEILRPHWRPFFQQFQTLTISEIVARWEEAKQLIHENGLTFNVHGGRTGAQRPWALDPVPVIISTDEAAALEAGLVQRVRLLDSILNDLYGPQELLTRGLLPPELVFGRNEFIHHCSARLMPGKQILGLTAVDVGRGDDGQFRVLSHGTEIPDGIGYALENRIILSRMLPELFQQCQVERLASFFHTFLENIRTLAPYNRDNPRVVLLSPGPQSPHYFGHAYLARYLNYTLAEGGDLTVRDNRVFLKLLGGLQPVDVIFRLIRSDMCDPLELRAGSTMGTPGLLQAVRTGNVAVVNTLGTGLVENPGLLPYLPALCREILNEDLKIQSALTWWCGDPLSLQHVLTHLPTLVIKSCSPGTKQEPIFGGDLSTASLSELTEKIRSHPCEYVGQEQVHLSTTPILCGERLEPRQLVLRSFITAQEDTFSMIPGGLARVSSTNQSFLISRHRGNSKDTWVLASEPVSNFSLLRSQIHPVELSRGGNDLPSRAADNLFWLGRYAARAEGKTRLFRAILVRLTESSGVNEGSELPILLRTALDQESYPEPGLEGNGSSSWPLPTDALLKKILDTENPDSLAGTLNSLYQAARYARDKISSDMWRIVNLLSLPPALRLPTQSEDSHRAVVAEPPAGWGNFFRRRGLPRLSEVLNMLSETVIRLTALGGMATESMTRGQGWRFLEMGRQLERASHLVDLIKKTLVKRNESEGTLLEAILEIFDSSMTYHRRYLGSPELAPVLDLLLADEENPRSLAFQLGHLERQVKRLPRSIGTARRSPEERLVLELLTDVRLADIELLASTEGDNTRPLLSAFVNQFHEELPKISEALSRGYLTHVKPLRQMAQGQSFITPEEL